MRWDRGAAAMAPAQRARIEVLWHQAQATNPHLYDGQLLCTCTLTVEGGTATVEGRFVPFKHYVAQLADPNLSLDVTPVGVSGVTIVRAPDGTWVLLGRRSPACTDYPGYLELAPSGGLDERSAQIDGTIDYVGALLRELSEETGLSPELCRAVKSFAIVGDPAAYLFDVGCTIELPGEVLQHDLDGGKEYTSLEFVAFSTVAVLFDDEKNPVVPTSRTLLSHLRASPWC